MNDAFELEGIEIRIQQKAIAEFVEQSNNLVVDYSASPKIYFSDDGSVYFFDSSIDEPVALSNLETFYKRIKFEEGQLRFYDRDLATFINLSFFTSARTEFVDKVNALVEGEVKRIPRDIAYDSKKQFLDALYLETDAINIEGSQVGDVGSGIANFGTGDLASIASDFINALFNSTMAATGENLFAFLINNYTYGLGSHSIDGFAQNSTIFNLDTGYMLNKATSINDRYFSIIHEEGVTAESATILADGLYATLVEESSQVSQSFDGMGFVLHKFLGRKSAEDFGNGFEIVTPLSIPASPLSVNNTFTIEASANGGSCVFDEENAIRLGGFSRGNLGIKRAYGSITSDISTGAYNVPLGDSYCQGIGSVSVVTTTLGDVNYFDETLIPVTAPLDVYAWFRTPDDTTVSDGEVTFDYVFTPTTANYNGSFFLNTETMVDFDTDLEVEANVLAAVTPTWVDGLSGSPTRKMVGVFEPGSITLKPKAGYVRPDKDFDTVYNEKQSLEFGISGSVDYGYINSTLGEIKFNSETTFEITDVSLFEVWYEDFDTDDNEGVMQISYEYIANRETREAIENAPEVSSTYYDGFITQDRYKHLLDYSLDHLAKIVSFAVSGLWFDALFQEFQAQAYMELDVPNKLKADGGQQAVTGTLEGLTDENAEDFAESLNESKILFALTMEEFLERANARFLVNDVSGYLGVISSLIGEIFYGEKVFYEKPELTDIDASDKNLLDYRNFFIYKGGSGLSESNMLYRDISQMNDIWLDVPDTYAIVPRVPNDYAISALVNFTADYMYGVPCRLDFRLWDSTSQVELDRVTYDFDRLSHTGRMGDILFENKEPLNVQLAYFGPVPSIRCTEEQFKDACDIQGRNVNEHVVIGSNAIFSDDAVDFDAFQIMANRINDFLRGQGELGVDEDRKIEIEAPRVLRVQWRMRFSDDVGNRPQLTHDLPQFTFDRYSPENENLFTLNVYSFAGVYGRGLTIQGVARFDGKRKRVLVDDESISVMPDAEYSVSLSASKNINCWVEGKTFSGFEIVAEKEFEGEVSWIAIRQRTDGEGNRSSDDPNYIPPCVIDREYKYSNYTDYELLKEEGYFADIEGTETQELTDEETVVEDTPSAIFIDPNGVRCSQECVDDCPEDYMCSPECYTASLTESGCGCCECINDNDCPPGYICNEVNECIEL
jgi:hypothetical protein